MQAEQGASTSAVQSAMSHALQHVPLINVAIIGDSSQVYQSAEWHFSDLLTLSGILPSDQAYA